MSAPSFLIAVLVCSGFAVAGQREAPSGARPTASAPRSGRPSASSSADKAALIPTSVLEKIPSRASGSDGRPADFVNFAIAGTESDLTLVFRAAGWTQVERAKGGAAASPPVSSAEEQYVGMPLGEEFLFGKPQDYGFAQDALITVVEARHDVRIWKAPFGLNGQTLWVGAASHEGPWWDNGTGMVSNAADPNVDDERDFLGNSLRTTGLVERSGYVASGARQGQTPMASEGLHSDGRMFVMILLRL